MKLLREYIRALLIESAIDPRIMKQIDTAQRLECKVYVQDSKENGKVEIVSTPDNLSMGKVEWEYNRGQYGNCSGAPSVNWSYSDENLGPLAYDVAIEVSGGLTSDRTEVSAAAENVWKNYMNSRSDVQNDQLDILDGYGYEQLTPGNEDDDCDQIPATQRYEDEWYKSAMAKVFFKNGTPVVDELRKRGMYEEV